MVKERVVGDLEVVRAVYSDSMVLLGYELVVFCRVLPNIKLGRVKVDKANIND